jgi:hypothetical protein
LTCPSDKGVRIKGPEPNGDGKDEVGFWRPGTNRFSLDANGNDTWDGASGGDLVSGVFGIANDVPVTGRW